MSSIHPPPKLFGTDGVRGRFGDPPLDEPTVRRLGRALARKLVERADTAPTPHVVLGGDTRASTPTLGRWLMAELKSGGCRVTWLGTVTTPTVAHVARRSKAACGVAISASHNPHPDNGIKLIDGDGFKWAPAAEARLEGRMAGLEIARLGDDAPMQTEPPIDHAAIDDYLASLHAGIASAGDANRLDGLHVALDTANGAASAFAEKLFADLGARVSLSHAAPNGSNINADCGSTHPEALSELIRSSGADLGFAFDGDADRVVLVDGDGLVRDGDAILYLWSRDLDARGELPGHRLVATSMSNLGLEVALARDGIGLVRCGVGDREVVATMRREGIVLGGEQSGHIVHLGLSTSGDGLLTALRIADLLHRVGHPIKDLLAGFERFPQLIRNVRVPSKPPLDDLPEVVRVQGEIENELGKAGRLVLRYSGTEPLARIMLEGPDRGAIDAMADRLAAAIEHELC